MGGLGIALSGAATPTAAGTPAGETVATAARSPMARTSQTNPDLAALARLYQRQAETWARGDGKAYATTYTPDADFVNVTGEHMRGRHEIGVKYQRYLANQLKNSRIHTLEEKIDLLSPTLALIIRKGCVLYGAETSCHPNTLSINTSIAVKTSGQWLIRSFHNTLVNLAKTSSASAKTK